MITRLQVRNFKSLRNIDVTLGPLNVLVGPNMSGKSNIVDVFKFLVEATNPPTGAEGIVNAMAARAGMPEVLWKGSDENVIAITLDGRDFLKSDETYLYQLELVMGVGGYTYLQKEALKLYRGGQESDLIKQERGERLLVNADGKTVSNVPSSSRSALERPPSTWDGAGLANLLSSWRFYQFVPATMKNPVQVGTGRVLFRHGENLSAWLMGLQTRYPAEWSKINQVMRDVFPHIETIVTWPTEQGLVHVASRETGLRRPVNVWGMSDGELVFLAFLSLIYSPADLGAALYCIEEPENHLHPRLLTTLVELTRQVREELTAAKSPLSQIIVTTQSPYLVDQMTLDEIIWVERKQGETTAFRPTDKGELRKLIEDEELGLGDIVYSGLLSGKE